MKKKYIKKTQYYYDFYFTKQTPLMSEHQTYHAYRYASNF